jgi:hypothetical protein
VEPVALEWAARNVGANAQLAHLIEARAPHMTRSQSPACDILALTHIASGGVLRAQVRDARAAPAAAADTPAAADASPGAPPPVQPLLRGVLRPGERFAFTMCNPPFFEDIAEAGRNPRTACGGSTAEMVCAGGEGAFVARHIAESATPALRHAVHWFTTMCGKKATLRASVAALRAARAPAVRTTVFSQGRTQRWGLAWSWSVAAGAAERAPLPVAAAPPAAPRPCAKASFTLRVGRSRGAAAEALAALCGAASAAGAARCVSDTALFQVTGALASDGGDGDDGAPGPSGKRARTDASAGGAASGAAACVCSFTATVLEHAPGELTVRMALRSAASPTLAQQTAFGALAQAVQHALAVRWPS